jgi:trimethylamine-N-oxide reductase (cytochrome c)
MLEKKSIDPLGEAKSDDAAIYEIAKKLGMYEKMTVGGPTADLIKNGYTNSGWKDLVTWDELNTKGYAVQGPKPGWEKDKPASFAFYTDPVKNPLSTPSGKLEYYSQQIVDNWPNDKERGPVAHYVPGGPASEGWTHDESRTSERAKKYPILMCIPCRNLGQHGTSTHVETPWVREVDKRTAWDGYMYQQAYVNSQDAAKRGIKNGDIIRIFNERGSVLASAEVGERVMPGVLSMIKAAGVDFIIPDQVNRGGSVNQLSPGTGANNGIGISKNAIGQTPIGYLAEYEKVTGAMMAEWRDKYPEAFQRDYDPAYGPLTSGWVVDGGVV